MKIIFETERLYLREFLPEDAAFNLKLVNSPDWLAYFGDRGIRNEADALAYINNSLRKSYAEHGYGLWLVANTTTGHPWGCAV